MAKYAIKGKNNLSGEYEVSGAKNSALKLLAASILGDGESIINNIPDIIDIHKMEDILVGLGCKLDITDHTVKINPNSIHTRKLDSELTKKIRASIVLAGPMLAKFSEVQIAQPGGCLIGARPIDDHIDVLSQFGVKVSVSGEYFHFVGKPVAGEITLPEMSVTATENAMMAAVLSEGTTHIRVAAAEPEIADLANFLNCMGADIKGAGTHEIVIKGVDKLKGCHYSVMPDRIEAATALMIACATSSELLIGPLIAANLSLVFKKLIAAGANFSIIKKNNFDYIKTSGEQDIHGVNINTRTYPGFPTDLQSVYAALMTQAKGETRIFETIFESRFGYTEELRKMGAKINIVSPHIINIKGPTKLKPSHIDAFDIRGGGALVLAALCTPGTTVIDHVEMIERGYEHLDLKLTKIGADIQRIE